MENWIIIIFSVLILAFIWLKEIRRKNKAHLNFRLAASTMAVLALYFIAQPLSFNRKLDSSKENTAVLLTDGFDKDTLAGLKNIPLYSAENSIAAGNKNVTFIPDLEYFSRSLADINKVHILGSGLTRHELEALKSRRLVFHPSSISGLRSVHWNNRIRSGERLTVQGSFKTESNRAVRILLRGLSTTLDSSEITGNQSFELSTIPKLFDKAVYSLVALSGRDTLANEKIPVIIEAKTSVKILMLSSSPDFENKFLKNWLSSERYALAIRTAISKNKFSTEFLNMESRDISRISPALLKEFDILIGDLTELSRLPATESAAIQNETALGMGLVIRADSAGGSGFYRRAFNIRQSRAIDQKNLSLNWEGRTAKKISPPAGWGLEIQARPGEQALVRDNRNHILASTRMFGQGRMIGTTVADTYTWMLGNNSANYSAYWSYILGKAARRTEAAEIWSVLNKYPVVNYPSLVRLETSTAGLPSASIGNVPIYFAQDPSQLYRWTAEYWPSASGWQSIRSGNKDNWWYVFDEEDWLSARTALKVENTARFVNGQKAITEKASGAVNTYMYTLPAIWFYALFLLGMGYLWWEGKMRA